MISELALPDAQLTRARILLLFSAMCFRLYKPTDMGSRTARNCVHAGANATHHKSMELVEGAVRLHESLTEAQFLAIRDIRRWH